MGHSNWIFDNGLPLAARDTAMVKMSDLNPQYITNEAGEKTSVILPISEFEELLEDIHDLALMAERRDEPTISHEELLA